jgi:6-phosphogluconolactonase (cycloisomerase 2 family)
MSKETKETHPEGREVVDRRAFLKMKTITGTIHGIFASLMTKAIMFISTGTFLFSLLLTMASTAHSEGRFLYIQSNNILEGQNSIIAYERPPDGKLKPLPGSPFLTGGTGMNNNTHGKLGPQDNDTPIVLSTDGKRLFTVNIHSNTIAAFDIMPDGSLRHVKGSPFPSMGVGPVSLSISDDILLVANRNGDYHQLEELRGKASGNYASFQINDDGSLTFLSKIDVKDGHKPIQVLVSSRDNKIVFGDDFEVDADFDGNDSRSWLAGNEPRVQGQLHVFLLDDKGHIAETDTVKMPETIEGYKYLGMDGVPSLPLGIWDHPKKDLLYVGFVTRNELGVYRYSSEGKLKFVTTVSNSGQDICWVLVNKAGTRLYTVNNLPRNEANDVAATVSIYDISGDKAEEPVEIGRLQLPLPGGWFVNNRMVKQPNSTAFQMDLDPTENFLYVINQRINQTDENTSKEGNILHTLKVDESGMLEVVASRHLRQDGVPYHSRPQGVVTLDR